MFTASTVGIGGPNLFCTLIKKRKELLKHQLLKLALRLSPHLVGSGRTACDILFHRSSLCCLEKYERFSPPQPAAMAAVSPKSINNNVDAGRRKELLANNSFFQRLPGAEEIC